MNFVKRHPQFSYLHMNVSFQLINPSAFTLKTIDTIEMCVFFLTHRESLENLQNIEPHASFFIFT